MKITITTHDATTSVHSLHDEAWVRVLHDDMQLDNFKKVQPFLTAEQMELLKPYTLEPCAAYSGLELDDESGEDEMEGFSLEDWYVLPLRETAKRRF